VEIMDDMTQGSQILIKKTNFFDISKILTAYKESSDDLKKKMMGADILTRKLGKFYLYFSTTPFYRILPIKIDSLVAYQNNHVVGFAYLLRQNSKKYSNKEKILGIFVTENYQSRGIGRKLLYNILEGETEVGLDVYCDNEKAIRLYQQYGFEIVDTVQHYHMKFKKKCD
jgi:ribosomal protein S18 acetylase RimI-like enzyme